MDPEFSQSKVPPPREGRLIDLSSRMDVSPSHHSCENERSSSKASSVMEESGRDPSKPSEEEDWSFTRSLKLIFKWGGGVPKDSTDRSASLSAKMFAEQRSANSTSLDSELAQSPGLEAAWADLDKSLWGEKRETDTFTSQIPPEASKKTYFSPTDPPMRNYSTKWYKSKGECPLSAETIDHDAEQLGISAPKTVTISEAAYKATQECLAQTQMALSFMDRALVAAINEDKKADEILGSPEPDLESARQHRSDANRVLGSVSMALDHVFPLTARASANLKIARRSTLLTTAKKLPKTIADSLHRAPLGSKWLFSGWCRPAKKEAEEYLKNSTPLDAKSFTAGYRIPKKSVSAKKGSVTVKLENPRANQSTQSAARGGRSFRGRTGRKRPPNRKPNQNKN